jgi:gluconokinase
MSFGEFVYRKLFGRTLSTISMASGTGLLDLKTCEYDAETLRVVGLRPDQLSPLGDLKDTFAGLHEPYAKRWPALKDVPWHPPVGDGACSNVGTGCVGPERIAVMIGTSGAMRVVWEKEAVDIPWGLWCYRIDRRRIVFGGALSEGGNLVEWCRHTFKLGTAEEVEREIAALEPDAHGLTFLPFLAGERSPGWAAHARAVIAGLHLASKPVDILRAGMEAVALRFALIYDLLKGAVPQAKEVWATGGALMNSAAWTQILADALGCPIVRCVEPEASSRGAAILALESMGVLKRLEDVSHAHCGVHAPDAGRHQKYRQALARQQHLYDLLIRV